MTLMLDHFVVHMDNDPARLHALKDELATLGIPFEPDRGKGTKGFKASNIWIGRQYFEIVRILRPDGGGWVPAWVARHQRGVRGLYCIFLKTDRLDELAARLREASLAPAGPERISYRAFFGLFRKSMPWRVLYLPPVPGTDLEISFIEYDPGSQDAFKPHMVPNADENGVVGVSSATVRMPFSSEARPFLAKLFPDAAVEPDVVTAPLDNGRLRFTPGENVHVALDADMAAPNHCRGSVTFENVTLQA